MVRAGRLSGGIILIVLGLFVLGIAYQIHSSATTSFSNLQCNNIIGAAVGSLYSPEADACSKASSYTTYGIVGMAAGVIMLIIGTVLTALSIGRGKGEMVAPAKQVQKVQGPIIKYCRICRKDTKWWDATLQEGNFLLHEDCWKKEMKQKSSQTR